MLGFKLLRKETLYNDKGKILFFSLPLKNRSFRTESSPGTVFT